MNFAELKSIVRADAWAEGEAENLVAAHDRFFVEALYDLQKNVVCLQSNNTDVYPQCATYFNCGMTVLPAPRGRILTVSVIDKIDSYTGLESADAEEDWCSRIYYHQVDYCHLAEYQRLCESCSSTASLSSSLNSILSSIFGVFRVKNRYPAPTDEGMETLPPLQQGFHYPQSSTDAGGRSYDGVWAMYRGRIYIAPWIQSTETVVIEWNGIKRSWSNADLVDDDPKFIQAVRNHVLWQHEKGYGDRENARALAVDLWGTPITTGTIGIITDLAHECHEENRIRKCNEAGLNGTTGGGARGMTPVVNSGGGTGQTYYNIRQTYTASCPSGQTGDSVTVVKEAGTYQSVLSQEDANAKALAAAQSEALSRLSCVDSTYTYYNVSKSYTAYCSEADDETPAAVGDPVTVVVPAGRYASDVSQDAADQAALEAAQAQAEALISCTYYNSEQTYTATCPDDTTGDDQSSTVAAGTVSSTISQSDADSIALAQAQSAAEALLDCGVDTYIVGNTPQSANSTYPCPNCVSNPHGFPVQVVIPANYFTQLTTAANELAVRANLNQQARYLAQNQADSLSRIACIHCQQLVTGPITG